MLPPQHLTLEQTYKTLITIMTLEEALEQINNCPFPEVAEGDIAWYPGGAPETDRGHRFRYDGSAWVSHPE